MSKTANILVVEDDAAMRETCVKLFRMNGHDADGASSAGEALQRIREGGDVDIVLTDLKMPGMDGVALLKQIKLLDPGIEVVLMTGYGSVKSAVEAMKHGAADYITKPFDTNELLMTIGKIVRLRDLRDEVVRLRSELRDKYRFDNIVGTSPSMRLVYEKIDAASKCNSAVLICGESGTGKELVARAIHYNGPRANGPFLPINCAAMPRALIESELFGHKKGAFTGAVSDSVGLFRAADGGTLFLDEIAEMPYGTQAKLLRALQERRIRPVGGTNEVTVDVRIVASTNHKIDEAIREKKLRADLYYRLCVIRIDLPPLRERLDDVPALVSHFIAKFNEVCQRNIKGIEEEALSLLARYQWPGSVRELETVIENTFALGKADVIRKCDLPRHIIEQAEPVYRGPGSTKEPILTLSESERELLVQALRMAKGNKSHAARILGVSRPKLYNMIRHHGTSR